MFLSFVFKLTAVTNYCDNNRSVLLLVGVLVCSIQSCSPEKAITIYYCLPWYVL